MTREWAVVAVRDTKEGPPPAPFPHQLKAKPPCVLHCSPAAAGATEASPKKVMSLLRSTTPLLNEVAAMRATSGHAVHCVPLPA